MPRPGGESDKLGNLYEAVWTVEIAIDVFRERFATITVEPYGDEALGIEFFVETPDGNRQFHSVKRQKQGGDWSIADLCRRDSSTGRSILGDLFNKRELHPNAELCFVSSTGANELRELSEAARAPVCAADFQSALSAELRSKFDQRFVPLCDDDAESALKALKSLEVITRSHNDLIRTVDRRIDELFCLSDRSALNPGDLRRLIADFVLGNLGVKIDAARLDELLRSNGIVARNDWTTERAIVTAANARYLSVTEVELINSAQIEREVVNELVETLGDTQSHGALLVAPGGYGKSCVLAQCLTKLRTSRIPFLCLRMDSFESCNTSRRLGAQLDLPASPVVVLAGIAGNVPSVLVVDQLDAISLVSGRNPRLWEVFRELCEEMRSYPQMKMLLACRDFDLSHDSRLRTLGEEQSGFVTCRLDKLTKAEIQASLAGNDLLLNDRQFEILAVPFHLMLFLQGDPNHGFESVGELYDRYWDRKRQKVKDRLGRDVYWNQVIDALAQRMSDSQVLFASKLAVDEWPDDAKAMTSEHVLTEVPDSNQYRFFHESFFDYAYARRFCASNRSLVEFLRSSEQHLFRRAQVRQILAYRREHDFIQYIADVREVFESQEVRFHIKRMVASGLRQINHPRPEEWQVIEPYLLEGELSRYVSAALRDHVGWFDLLDSQQVFCNWLTSDNPSLNNAAIWFLEAHRLHDDRSTRIAELVAPYSQREDHESQQRIMRVLSWGIAHKSNEMAAIYLDLIARGAYDAVKSDATGSDFWSQLYNVEKESPKFIIDVVAAWFHRVAIQFDISEAVNFLHNCPQNHSHTGSMIIGKAATDEPEYFVEKILPLVAATIVKTEECRGGRIRNRAWPWLSNHGDPFDINDAMLLSLRKSLQHLAKQNVELFRKHAETIASLPHETFAYLLLRSWADNPQEFADDCVNYLVSDLRRLNIGYDSWSGGGGTGENAVSRTALKVISPYCSLELLGQLESRIIGYCDKLERQYPRWRGAAELLVLRSLDSSRISKKTQLRIEELERKFPVLSDTLPEEDETGLTKFVGSPISNEIAALMTDEQWVSAMKKYGGTTDRFGGGPIELSRLLANFASKDRIRFATLATTLPASVDFVYYSAILEGLCSRHTNLSKEQKREEQIDIDSTPTALFLSVIDRLHALPDRPCGSAIVGCIRTLSKRQLPPRVLEVVSYYATSDPDPTEDIWQQDAGGNKYYGGNPHDHGINCVRGQAAECICTLLFDDQRRIDHLKPTLVALASDPIISVRTCAIQAFLPVLNFSRDFAIELFLKACGEQKNICATQPFDNFIHYAIYTHYSQLRELLLFALNCDSNEAVENAARRISLAELQDVDVGGDAVEIRNGSEVMRKAAADVYARNISHKAVGDRCAELLEEMFDDPSQSVKEEISSAFFGMAGERLLQLKDFIARFVESPCFEHETDRLLRALEESNVELPQIICRAAERILGFLGEEGTHIAYHGSMVAHSISTLIVRQYEQATDGTLKTRCLDLIDRMERIGYLGISEELNKIDR